jgi:hypothetical protein
VVPRVRAGVSRSAPSHPLGQHAGIKAGTRSNPRATGKILCHIIDLLFKGESEIFGRKRNTDISTGTKLEPHINYCYF